jgi:hypothetical protein
LVNQQTFNRMSRPAAFLQAEYNSIDFGPFWHTVSKWASLDGCRAEAERLNAKRDATFSIIEKGPRYRALSA